MINVTKAFLPPLEEYLTQLKRAWNTGWITNQGVLVKELEATLKSHLNVRNLLYCTNGTVVLQMALKALNITKDVITTPFSYVATTNSILWQGCNPIFVDIDPRTYCIDPTKIEERITSNTQAILATHVYGTPCDISQIQIIAKRHNLKVIYDGAHSFGTMLNSQPVLSYGDVSTCSFHATKIFHTVEGGCVITNDSEIAEKLFLYRSFGHKGDDYYSIGINAKNSEFHAAMGLANFPYVDQIIASRKDIFDLYKTALKGTHLRVLDNNDRNVKYNYSYFPILLKDEDELLRVQGILEKCHVNTRRYFYPSLNTLDFLSEKFSCPISEDYSRRILCLPLYFELSSADVLRICNLILESLR